MYTEREQEDNDVINYDYDGWLKEIMKDIELIQDQWIEGEKGEIRHTGREKEENDENTRWL